jgi:hypothetical protein
MGNKHAYRYIYLEPHQKCYAHLLQRSLPRRCSDGHIRLLTTSSPVLARQLSAPHCWKFLIRDPCFCQYEAVVYNIALL